MRKVAIYKDERGAEARAAELRKKFPEKEFRVISWGWDFAISVWMKGMCVGVVEHEGVS
jgi:hypothetical protein